MALLLPVAVFALVGAGCSQDDAEQGILDALNAGGKDIGVAETTAAGIIGEVKTFLAEEADASNPILVGLNSSEAGFYITDFTPPADNLKNTDGTGTQWYYLFAKDASVLADKELTEEETLVVQYNQGKLRMVNDVFIVTHDIPVFIENTDEWKIDTDQAYQIFMTEAQKLSDSGAPQCTHLDYTMGTLHSYNFDDDSVGTDEDDHALVYDLTCYIDSTNGWETKIDAVTGAVTGTEEVTFSYQTY